MSAAPEAELMVVRGSLDAEGRLVEADPPLADLHRRAGGREGGALAVPQIAMLARLARRLGIVISRGAFAADCDRDLDLWIRAEPVGDRVELSIGGWTEKASDRPFAAPAVEREADFARAAADWVWETDETLRLTMVSQAAAAAVGRPPAALAGQPLTSLFRFREREDGSLPILGALAERRRFEDQLAELRIGSRETYLLAGVPLIDGTGRFAGFRGSAVAIAADAVPEALSSDASPFGERLDRALRDPLAHIISHSETLASQADGPLQPSYAEYAADIASAGRHLLSLVDDLVDLQAIERPDFAPAAEAIDLADAARQAAGLLAGRAAEREVRIEGLAETEALPATGEYRRLLQILTNLIANAIRYSPENGVVRLTAARPEGFVAVTVADDGKGIAEADCERIFEKFERVDPTEPGGTGLGLYIARRLARAMGGDISCESAPGEGARFTLTLPAR
ncbi:MAG TPA: HAMP domain-containing sensor histidine kinase [Allosphingosinicella sp.]|nr:HAMP domain-containing sensor histidine kinase [Allosphingosinicella sp.]